MPSAHAIIWLCRCVLCPSWLKTPWFVLNSAAIAQHVRVNRTSPRLHPLVTTHSKALPRTRQRLLHRHMPDFEQGSAQSIVWRESPSYGELVPRDYAESIDVRGARIAATWAALRMDCTSRASTLLMSLEFIQMRYSSLVICLSGPIQAPGSQWVYP